MGVANHEEKVTAGSRLHSRSVDKIYDSDISIGGTGAPITVNAGKEVTGWTKTDGDTAECTLPAGHGFTTGTFDVYDSDGIIIRYGVPGTVATNTLSLDGGTGDDFPASSTEGIIVSRQQQVNVSIDGDNLGVISVLMNTCGGHVDFQDADGDTIRAFSLVADEPDMWDADMSINPYTGDPIVVAYISNNSETAGTFEIIGNQDCTP